MPSESMKEIAGFFKYYHKTSLVEARQLVFSQASFGAGLGNTKFLTRDRHLDSQSWYPTIQYMIY